MLGQWAVAISKAGGELVRSRGAPGAVHGRRAVGDTAAGMANNGSTFVGDYTPFVFLVS